MIDQLEILYRKYSVLVWPVVVILVSLVVVVFIIIPQFQSYLTDQTKLSTQTISLNRFEVKAQELEQIDEEVYVNGLRAALSALPTGKEVPQALILLQTLVNQTGMTLEGIKFSSLTSESLTPNLSGKSSFEVTATVSGDAEGLKELLNSIPKQQRKFNVNQVSMQSVARGTAIEADVSIEVFYQPAVTSTASIDAEVPKLTKQEQELLQQIMARVETSSSTTLDTQVPLGKQNPFE